MSNTVLVTGGAGFIGSHTVVELLENDFDVVIIDNLCNASIGCSKSTTLESISRLEKITGKSIVFYKVDLLDRAALENVFQKHKFSYVIHFAGLKAVGESCQVPLQYYKNNLEGTITLLEVMKEKGVHNLVFSSSATVYGNPQYLPLDEKHPTGGCTNPYGRTKYFIEQMLMDLAVSDKRYRRIQWNIVLLRYFNPIGAHKSGLIGEDPQGIPNNLMPFVSQVAVGRLPKLTVYGKDYATPDGTGVRDYIHVVDLAIGHVAAIRKVKENCGCRVYNLGTGNGYSVLDMVKAFEKASGKKIPYEFADPRSGDVASCYADPKLADEELGWKAIRNLDVMCEDLWKWQSMNPEGFKSATSENGVNGH